MREPGLHLRELPRRLGLSLRSVRYHLDALHHDDLATPHRSGRFERWFPARTFSETDRALISALHVRSERRILESLRDQGPGRFGELADRVGISPASLSRGLGQLVEDGLLTLTADRRYRLSDPDALRMRLTLYRAQFPDLLADAAREIFDD